MAIVIQTTSWRDYGHLVFLVNCFHASLATFSIHFHTLDSHSALFEHRLSSHNLALLFTLVSIFSSLVKYTAQIYNFIHLLHTNRIFFTSHIDTSSSLSNTIFGLFTSIPFVQNASFIKVTMPCNCSAEDARKKNSIILNAHSLSFKSSQTTISV